MSSKRSIRAEKTPPRRSRGVKQMVDIRGFALATEQGAPLVTEKDEYRRSEYGSKTAPSVVLDSESYRTEALSTQNSFSKIRHPELIFYLFQFYYLSAAGEVKKLADSFCAIEVVVLV